MNEIEWLHQKIKELERQVRDLQIKSNKTSTGRYIRGSRIYGPVAVAGGIRLKPVAVDPAYIDGYASIYFLSDGGGVDEVKVRGKIGAEQEEAILLDVSP